MNVVQSENSQKKLREKISKMFSKKIFSRKIPQKKFQKCFEKKI